MRSLWLRNEGDGRGDDEGSLTIINGFPNCLSILATNGVPHDGSESTSEDISGVATTEKLAQNGAQAFCAVLAVAPVILRDSIVRLRAPVAVGAAPVVVADSGLQWDQRLGPRLPWDRLCKSLPERCL